MPSLRLEPLPPRIGKGDILRFVCDSGGIPGAQVGRIDLRGALALVEVPAHWLGRLVKALDGATLQDRRLHVRAAESQPATGDDHFAHLARCLEWEAQAEAERIVEDMASASGESKFLTGLVMAGEDSGLGGRCILSLAKRNRKQPLPWNPLEPGTPVVLTPEDHADEERWRG